MFIRAVKDWINQWLVEQEDGKQAGQGLVEYALILILVAVIMVAVMAVLGPGIGNIYSGIVGSL